MTYTHSWSSSPQVTAYLLPAAHFAAQATYGEDDEEWEDMDDEMLAEQEEEESRAKDHEFEARMPEEPQKSVCYKVKQTATRKGTRLVSRPEEFATPTGKKIYQGDEFMSKSVSGSPLGLHFIELADGRGWFPWDRKDLLQRFSLTARQYSKGQRVEAKETIEYGSGDIVKPGAITAMAIGMDLLKLPNCFARRGEKRGNTRAYAQVVCGTGLLLGITTWFIQSSASALGLLRGEWLGGHNSLGITVAVNLAYVALARLLVRTTPTAEGSGYPQMKAMFFGNVTLADSSLSRAPASLVFLSVRTFCVKAASLILVVAAGLPIGQEGPNVHLAACLARHIRPKFFERNLQSEISVHILHAACACGVAATFSSPLGGVLLSLELMLPQIYTFQVYWGCFVAAFCGAVSTYLLKSWDSGAGYAQLLDSDVSPNEGMVRNYPLGCAVFCLIIGAVFGLLGGAFNLMHDRMARLSSKFCSGRGPVRGLRWRDLAMRILRDNLSWVDIRELVLSFSGAARAQETQRVLHRELPGIEFIRFRNPTGRAGKSEILQQIRRQRS
ncbi:clh-3 [Symbiodinium sp. CCMP2592]|nr:clh-3 [Symbiodinium sp. CCMP2592]